jgi:hypothetical protein
MGSEGGYGGEEIKAFTLNTHIPIALAFHIQLNGELHFNC